MQHDVITRETERNSTVELPDGALAYSVEPTDDGVLVIALV